MSDDPQSYKKDYEDRQLKEKSEEEEAKALIYHHESPYKDQLNPIINHFLISHIYTKTKIQSNSTTFTGHSPLWSFYQAKQDQMFPPIILIDENNMITPSDNQLSMKLMDNIGAIRKYVTKISPKARKKIEQVMQDNGVLVPSPREREKMGWDFAVELSNNNLVWTPINKLKNPGFIEKLDWPFFIETVLRWESIDKDPRLNLIHKTQLLRGIDQRVNTHNLVVLNAGVGKSMHFQMHGINYDRVTKNSFLGFAKSKDEVYRGTVDGTDLPTAIDQIEVGSWGIMDYMFNLMESGESMVSSGATTFPVSSKSPFSLLANPLGEDFNPQKSFSSILAHLTDNPAIGRRFGIIAYDSKYRIIKTKLTSQSLEWWKDTSVFFRAIEQYLKPKIEAVYRDDKLWDYLNKEIRGYSERIKIIADGCSDATLKTFLLAHGDAGQTRVKAAAFNASLVDYLQELHLDTFRIEEVIEHAEDDLLPRIIDINIQSANNIVQTITEETGLLRSAYLDAIPEYMKEIVYAVEQMRHQGIITDVFMLSVSDYKPQFSNYKYIGQCTKKLIDRKKGIVDFNKMTSRLFKFTFEPVLNDLKITITDMTPIHLPDLPVFTELPKGDENKNTGVSLKQGKSGKSGKKVVNLDPKIDEISGFISPKTGYTLQQIAGYFSYDLIEVAGLLETMENEGMIKKDDENRWWNLETGTGTQQEFEAKPSGSLQSQLQQVLQVITDMERVRGSVKDTDLYETLETEHGINKSDRARFISMLMKDGTIYMPRPSYYRRSD